MNQFQKFFRNNEFIFKIKDEIYKSMGKNITPKRIRNRTIEPVVKKYFKTTEHSSKIINKTSSFFDNPSKANALRLSEEMLKVEKYSLMDYGRQVGLSILKNIFLKTKTQVGLGSLTRYQIETATYLKDIPQVFGCALMQGNIIWSTCINAQEYNKVIQQKKFVHYKTLHHKKYETHTVSFAVAFCKGEIDELEKIYLDGMEVQGDLYDIKIYIGSETQTPDPTISEHLGNDKTPAFRGLCYLVVRNLNLAEFGYKIPKVTCIIKRSISAVHEDHKNLVSKIANFIQSDSSLKPQYKINALIIDKYSDLLSILLQLEINIIFDGSKVTCHSENSQEIIEINKDIIAPIEQDFYLHASIRELSNSNFRITYLDSQSFKVKNYISEFLSHQKIYDVALQIALEDEEVSKFCRSYKQKILNSSEIFIFQIIPGSQNINIGFLFRSPVNSNSVLKVVKKVYHQDSTITLFCCKKK